MAFHIPKNIEDPFTSAHRQLEARNANRRQLVDKQLLDAAAAARQSTFFSIPVPEENIQVQTVPMSNEIVLQDQPIIDSTHSNQSVVKESATQDVIEKSFES